MPKFVVIRKYVVSIPPPSERRDALMREMETNNPESERSSDTTGDLLGYLVDSQTVGDHTDKVVLARQSWSTMRSDDPDWDAI